MKLFFLCPQEMSGGRYLLFLFFLSLILPGFMPKISVADGKSIFADNKGGVVILFAYDKEGHQIGHATGFVVRNDGAVLTNYHFISNAAEIKIKTEDALLDVKGLLYLDRENDIAMLKIEGKDLTALKIGDNGIGPAGQKIYVIGSPQGEDKVLAEGTLTRIKDITPVRKLLLMTAPVTKGSSGSPVFNENGEVIGIATFFTEETTRFYFALPVAFIKNKLSLNKTVPLVAAKLTAFENSAEYWFNLGAAYDSLGMYTDASGAYQKAVEIAPEDATAHDKLGIVYAKLDIYSFAIREHNEAIRLKPDYQEAYYNLGIVYIKSDMTQAAIETFEKAIRLKPDDVKSYNNLAVAFYKSDRLKEALEASKQALLIKPDFPEALYNLGAVYYRMEMYAEAAEALKQFIRLKPDIAEVHLKLGLIYSIQDTASALAEYEILKKLDADSAKVLHEIIRTKMNISSEPAGPAPAVTKETIEKTGTTDAASGISMPGGPAAPRKKNHTSKASGAPVESPGSSDKLAGPTDISKQETAGESRRPPDKDLYSVQVSIFKIRGNAESLTKALSEKGYNVFMKKEDKGDRYRVLVGKFTEKNEALKQARIILSKENMESIIFKH